MPSAIADASVWLECSGELIDVRSVDVLRIREAAPGIELIESMFALPDTARVASLRITRGAWYCLPFAEFLLQVNAERIVVHDAR
jgi:hypothetical protein